MEVAGFMLDQCHQGSGSYLSCSWPSLGCKMPETLSHDLWLKLGHMRNHRSISGNKEWNFPDWISPSSTYSLSQTHWESVRGKYLVGR